MKDSLIRQLTDAILVEKYKQEIVPNYILDQVIRLHGHTARILIEGMLVPGIKIIS